MPGVEFAVIELAWRASQTRNFALKNRVYESSHELFPEASDVPRVSAIPSFPALQSVR
jgi:hypothetical protein